MMLTALMSVERRYEGLTVVPSISNSRETLLRFVNSTDTPVVIPANAAVAIARNVQSSAITQFVDFYQICETDNERNCDFMVGWIGWIGFV